MDSTILSTARRELFAILRAQETVRLRRVFLLGIRAALLSTVAFMSVAACARVVFFHAMPPLFAPLAGAAVFTAVSIGAGLTAYLRSRRNFPSRKLVAGFECRHPQLVHTPTLLIEPNTPPRIQQWAARIWMMHKPPEYGGPARFNPFSATGRLPANVFRPLAAGFLISALMGLAGEPDVYLSTLIGIQSFPSSVSFPGERHVAAAPRRPQKDGQTKESRTDAVLAIQFTVHPPDYLGLPAFTTRSRTLSVTQGSRVSVSARIVSASDKPIAFDTRDFAIFRPPNGPSAVIPLSLDGEPAEWTPAVSGTWTARHTRCADQSGWIQVNMDLPPSLELGAPAEISNPASGLELLISASDDHAIVELNAVIRWREGETWIERVLKIPGAEGKTLFTETRRVPGMFFSKLPRDTRTVFLRLSAGDRPGEPLVYSPERAVRIRWPKTRSRRPPLAGRHRRLKSKTSIPSGSGSSGVDARGENESAENSSAADALPNELRQLRKDDPARVRPASGKPLTEKRATPDDYSRQQSATVSHANRQPAKKPPSRNESNRSPDNASGLPSNTPPRADKSGSAKHRPDPNGSSNTSPKTSGGMKNSASPGTAPARTGNPPDTAANPFGGHRNNTPHQKKTAASESGGSNGGGNQGGSGHNGGTGTSSQTADGGRIPGKPAASDNRPRGVGEPSKTGTGIGDVDQNIVNAMDRRTKTDTAPGTGDTTPRFDTSHGNAPLANGAGRPGDATRLDVRGSGNGAAQAEPPPEKDASASRVDSRAAVSLGNGESVRIDGLNIDPEHLDAVTRFLSGR